jgi:hypothetical protein
VRNIVPLALLVVGCTPGVMQTVTLGAAFNEKHNGIVLAVEISPLLHEHFQDLHREPSPSYPPDLHGPHRYLGVAATAAVGTELKRHEGASGYVAVGLDYLPFLYEHGGMVGWGGQYARSTGVVDGSFGIMNLWFAGPVGSLAGAPVVMGLMLRVQWGSDGESGGPQLVMSRVSL